MKGFKKGQLMDRGVEYIMGLVIIGLLAGAGAIALAAFSSGQTGNALNVINNATSGLLNFSIQLPSVGTIAGVGLIILVIVGAFGLFFMNRRG